MRQISGKHHKSLRLSVGIGRACTPLGTLAGQLVIALAMTLSGVFVQQAFAQSAAANGAGVNSATDQATDQDTASNNGAMSREEILALFEREARAAYQMNKQACEPLSAQDKKVCLARARLQFDADMRYAQKRADQGY